MKKYRLLKDLPDCPKGTIGYEQSGSIVFETARPQPQDHSRNIMIMFSTNICIGNPEWFEPVHVENPRFASKREKIKEFREEEAIPGPGALTYKINELIKVVNEL